jgi:hypothetical protein
LTVADRVVFLRPDAERIARAVRTVEVGNRNETPLRFGRVVESGKRVFRVGTFTGEWVKNTEKTITFKNQTTTPNTVSVYNLFADIPVPATGTAHCAIARDGGWYLIAAECS